MQHLIGRRRVHAPVEIVVVVVARWPQVDRARRVDAKHRRRLDAGDGRERHLAAGERTGSHAIRLLQAAPHRNLSIGLCDRRGGARMSEALLYLRHLVDDGTTVRPDAVHLVVAQVRKCRQPRYARAALVLHGAARHRVRPVVLVQRQRRFGFAAGRQHGRRRRTGSDDRPEARRVQPGVRLHAVEVWVVGEEGRRTVESRPPLDRLRVGRRSAWERRSTRPRARPRVRGAHAQLACSARRRQLRERHQLADLRHVRRVGARRFDGWRHLPDPDVNPDHVSGSEMANGYR